MITVDDREPQHNLMTINSIKTALGHEMVEVKRLMFADYAFESGEPMLLPTTATRIDGEDVTEKTVPVHRPARIGMEISTVADVCSKVSSGRLAYQVSGMLENYDVPILLIVGIPQPDKLGYVFLPGAKSGVAFKRLWDILFSAQSHGLIITFAENKGALADRILQSYHHWQKPLDSHKFFRKQGVMRDAVIPMGDAIDSRVQALMAWPGIGEDRARAALTHYGSIQNVMIAAMGGTLHKIPGWGKGTEASVSRFIREEVGHGYKIEDSDSETLD